MWCWGLEEVVHFETIYIQYVLCSFRFSMVSLQFRLNRGLHRLRGLRGSVIDTFRIVFKGLVYMGCSDSGFV